MRSAATSRSLHLEHAGDFLSGDFNYYEISGEGRYFLSVANRAVVAVRVRAGSIDGTGDDRGRLGAVLQALLPGRRDQPARLGTLRRRAADGWRQPDRRPFVHRSSRPSCACRSGATSARVLFLDGGNVWTNPWDFNFNDLRYDVGPGIRYNTPIGPIRADLGYQLNPIPGLQVNGEPETRRFRFHFSIGQAF